MKYTPCFSWALDEVTFHARHINYALGVTFSYLINFINEFEMTLNLFP